MDSRRDGNVIVKQTNIIDPTNMSVDESFLLYHVLQAQAAKGIHFYPQNISMSIPVGFVPLSSEFLVMRDLQLTHSIVRRQSDRDHRDYRFEVHGNIIAEGGYAHVVNVVATLKPMANHFDVKKHHPRIIKIMIANNDGVKLRYFTNYEYEMTKYDDSIRVKRPVFFNTSYPLETRSMLVMRRIPGEDLSNIIKRDQLNKSKVNKIETEIRIRMVIAVARAVEKVHHANIIHGDIKSSNVMIDMNSPLLRAKIIDFGGSRERGTQPRLNTAFTEIFAAPEVLDGGQPSVESDVYSFAWIISEIMRADPHPSQRIMNKIVEMNASKSPLSYKKHDKYLDQMTKKMQSVAHECHFDNLFCGIHDLNKLERQTIKDLLTKISSLEPQKRGFIGEVIHVFENLHLGRVLANLPPPVKQNETVKLCYQRCIEQIELAHKAGINLRMSLLMYTVSERPGISIENITKIRELFTYQLTEMLPISTNPDAVQLLIERLDMLVLVGSKNISEMIARVESVIDIFIGNRAQLIDMQLRSDEIINVIQRGVSDPDIKIDKKIEAQYLYRFQQIKSDIETLIEKRLEYLTIDRLAKLNAKMQVKISALLSHFKHLTSSFDKEIEKMLNGKYKNHMRFFYDPQRPSMFIPSASTASAISSVAAAAAPAEVQEQESVNCTMM